MSTIDPDGHDCAWCPARRFRSRQALADHEQEHHLAELAGRPADPFAVLREAMVWAEDVGAFDAIADDIRALLDVTALAPGKPIPGYVATLVRSEGSVLVRVALPPDGRSLAVMIAWLSTSLRLRVRLPPEFHMAPPSPAPRDTAAIAREFDAAVEAGLRTQESEE